MDTLQSLLVPSIVVALMYLGALAGAAVVAALNTGGRRDDVAGPDDAVSLSRFTIPVSIIVPTATDLSRVSHTIAALLGLNYPEVEVIVVVDGASGQAFESLAKDWALEAKEFFYRQSIPTAAVRRIYRSGRDPRVTLVDKATGHRADAVNCGVNIARYRYVTAISPDLTFDAKALLRLMSAPLRDPGAVLGASSHVEGVGLFERLGSARSLMASRLIWRALGRGFASPSSVHVWRRDVVLEAKGLSLTAFDPDLDLTRRAVMAAVATGVPGRFSRGADVFGQAAAGTVARGLRDGGRRTMGVLGCLRLLTPRGVRAFGASALAGFFASELLTPIAELWVIVGLTVAGALGVLPWGTLVAAVALLSFGHATVTTAALLMRGAASGSPEDGELTRLLVAGPLEFVLYRPVLAAASLTGLLPRKSAIDNL